MTTRICVADGVAVARAAVCDFLHKLELPSRRAAAVLYSSTVEAVAGRERAGVQ
jgi:hypothetical protein